MSPAHRVEVLTAGERSELAAMPQLYWTEMAAARLRHPLLARVLNAAATRWRRGDLIVQTQTVALRAGVHPGIPVWQSVPSTACGEVAVACLGAESLLQIDDESVPGDTLAFAAAASRWRFAAATDETTAVVLLIRPREGVATSELPRHCARVFAPSPPRRAAPLPVWAQRRTLRFRSGFQVLGRLSSISSRQLVEEPLFAAASPHTLLREGGPAARAFVAALPPAWREPDADVIVQVRRNELSPGWYPALIGWHMDGTSRMARRSDGTPDLRDPGRSVEQILACAGTASPTAFLVGDVALPEVPVGAAGSGPGVWQTLLLDDLAHGRVREVHAPPDTLVQFGLGGFHTASRAERPGWRLFLKAMRGRGDAPRDERPTRGSISWPSDATTFPDDPCGVFPEW